MRYGYLFPFEKVPREAHIYIYGAGDVGFEYLEQVLITKYCHCIGFLDRAYDKCPKSIVPIYPPKVVKDKMFDYIVIAMKTGIYVDSIKSTLENYGVPEEKIVYVGLRSQVSVLCDCHVSSMENTEEKLATEYPDMISVSMQVSSALGDCIVRRRIFDEIIRIEPKCLFDIYVPYADGYIKAIYGNHPNLNRVINDAGVLYKKRMNKYLLAISSINPFLAVDFWNQKEISKKSVVLESVVFDMIQQIEAYGLKSGDTTRNYIHYNRMRYNGMNYYSSYNQYCKFFDIKNYEILIPLDLDAKSDFERLNLSKYITINCETGVTSLNNDRIIPKQWPIERFEKLVELFSQRYPKIKVVQIGGQGAYVLENAHLHLFGENLEVVKYVLKNSLLHVDIEGGLVHLATNLGTKSVVLFGPTPVEFFGYPQNINIVAPACSGCHGLYNELNVCAKKMKYPECMQSITPNMVMDSIEEYMDCYENFV